MTGHRSPRHLTGTRKSLEGRTRGDIDDPPPKEASPDLVRAAYLLGHDLWNLFMIFRGEDIDGPYSFPRPNSKSAYQKVRTSFQRQVRILGIPGIVDRRLSEIIKANLRVWEEESRTFRELGGLLVEKSGAAYEAFRAGLYLAQIEFGIGRIKDSEDLADWEELKSDLIPILGKLGVEKSLLPHLRRAFRQLSEESIDIEARRFFVKLLHIHLGHLEEVNEPNLRLTKFLSTSVPGARGFKRKSTRILSTMI